MKSNQEKVIEVLKRSINEEGFSTVEYPDYTKEIVSLLNKNDIRVLCTKLICEKGILLNDDYGNPYQEACVTIPCCALKIYITAERRGDWTLYINKFENLIMNKNNTMQVNKAKTSKVEVFMDLDTQEVIEVRHLAI